VVCLGLRRAGSTLQYNLARTLVEQLNAGCGAGFLAERDSLEARMRDIKGKGLICVVKTYGYDLDWLRNWRCKCSILSIFRDLRDVYSSHLKKRTDLTFAEWLVRIESDLTAIGNLERTHRTLYQKYERVFFDLEGAIQEISTFLGLEPTASDIARVKELNTIEAALNTIRYAFSKRQRVQSLANKFLRSLPRSGKQIARVAGLTKLVRWVLPSEDVVSPGFRLHPDHISASRGEPGRWRDELSEREAVRITEHFRCWLEEHGYLDDPQGTRMSDKPTRAVEKEPCTPL